MNIPTVALAGISVPQSPELGPRLSARTFDAFNAPNRALVGLGQEISQTGRMLANEVSQDAQLIAQFEMKKRALEESGKLASEDNLRDKVMGDLKTALSQPGNTDPDKWDKFLSESETSYKKGFEQRFKDANPELKARAEAQMSNALSNARVDFEVNTNVAKIAKANSAHEIKAQRFMDLGDDEGAKTEIAQMSISPQGVDALMSKMRYQALQVQISKDPIGMHEKLKGDVPRVDIVKLYPELSEGQRKSLENIAQSEVYTVRKDVAEEIGVRRMGGEIIGDKELDGLVLSKRMSPAAAKAIKKEQLRGNENLLNPQQRVGLAELYKDIDYFSDSKDYVALASLRERIAVLPSGYISNAGSMLDKKISSFSTSEGKPLTVAFKNIEQFETKALKDLGEKDTAKRLSVLSRYAKMRDGLTDYVKKSPKASELDIAKKMAELYQLPAAQNGMDILAKSRK